MFQLARKRGQRRAQCGSTLIEVLVTMVVIASGLLGFAALLGKSVAANREAMYRTEASIFASDILESMRANRTAAMGGAYNIALGAAAPTTTDIAGTDLSNWIHQLQSAFPDGKASVDVASAVSGNTSVSVTIQWGGATASSSRSVGSFVTQSAL